MPMSHSEGVRDRHRQGEGGCCGGWGGLLPSPRTLGTAGRAWEGDVEVSIWGCSGPLESGQRMACGPKRTVRPRRRGVRRGGGCRESTEPGLVYTAAPSDMAEVRVGPSCKGWGGGVQALAQSRNPLGLFTTSTLQIMSGCGVGEWAGGGRGALEGPPPPRLAVQPFSVAVHGGAGTRGTRHTTQNRRSPCRQGNAATGEGWATRGHADRGSPRTGVRQRQCCRKTHAGMEAAPCRHPRGPDRRTHRCTSFRPCGPWWGRWCLWPAPTSLGGPGSSAGLGGSVSLAKSAPVTGTGPRGV